MRKSTTAACVLMFGTSFVLLAGVYQALPCELPVLRIPFASVATAAPKSAFTAFRVPLINLTHGLIAAVMLSHATDFDDERRRASYVALFSTLLFAIALKSDFEALEISGLALRSGPFGRWVTAGTVISVVGGLALAAVRGRNVPIPWTELKLSMRDKLMLAGLFVSYLALVAASLLGGHPIGNVSLNDPLQIAAEPPAPFRLQEWNPLVKSKGDLSSLGIDITRDKPIAGFDKFRC